MKKIRLYLKEKIFDEQGVQCGLREAAGVVRKALVDAPDVMNRTLSLIVGYSKRGEPARPGSYSAHSANCDPQSLTMAAFDSESGPMSDTLWSSASVSPGVTDPLIILSDVR